MLRSPFDLRTVTRYGSRYEFLILMIVLSLVGAGVMVLFDYLLKLDPEKNLWYSGKSLQMTGLDLCGLIAVINISFIRMALTGNPSVVMEVIPFAVLILTAFMGNYMTSLRPNYLAGFRTPWALENEVVWQKTHRFGGKLLFWSNLAMLVPVALIPNEIKMVVVAAFIMSVTVYILYYSYRVYRHEKANPT